MHGSTMVRVAERAGYRQSVLSIYLPTVEQAAKEAMPAAADINRERTAFPAPRAAVTPIRQAEGAMAEREGLHLQIITATAAEAAEAAAGVRSHIRMVYRARPRATPSSVLLSAQAAQAAQADIRGWASTEPPMLPRVLAVPLPLRGNNV